MSKIVNLTQVHPIEVEGDWFIVPNNNLIDFSFDHDSLCNNEIDGDYFEYKWGHYRINGCLSQVKFYTNLDETLNN